MIIRETEVCTYFSLIVLTRFDIYKGFQKSETVWTDVLDEILVKIIQIEDYVTLIHSLEWLCLNCSFRLGKMYHYTLEKYDVDSLDSFVNGWYKNVASQSVPLPKTPL